MLTSDILRPLYACYADRGCLRLILTALGQLINNYLLIINEDLLKIMFFYDGFLQLLFIIFLTDRCNDAELKPGSEVAIVIAQLNAYVFESEPVEAGNG